MSAARALPAALLGLWLLALPAMAAAPESDDASSEAAVSPKEQVAIGVVAFERVAPEGGQLPDVAELLTARFAANPSVRAVGPSGLSQAGSTGAAPQQVQAWAREAGVDALVTGRATSFGRKTSLDVRLWSAEGGNTIATFVEEAPRPEALPDAVNRLATEIAGRLGAGPPGNTAEPASDGEGKASDAEDKKKGDSLFPVGGEGPLSIRSDELEAIEQGGRRTLLFRRNVHVSQGNLRLKSDRLEAIYPPGSSQPERLVASGGVQVAQLGREMLCDEATYFHGDQRLLCVGNAELREGDDRVQGKEIEILLKTNRIKVKGGAILNVNQSADASGDKP
jgi:lipopolysaccharide transport protein LptA